MSINFEELDYRQTHLGELILRRRRVPSLGDTEVFEVKLGDDFLMSSLFNTGEIALAQLGLAELDTAQLDVVVAGLHGQGGVGSPYGAICAGDRGPGRSHRLAPKRAGSPGCEVDRRSALPLDQR